MEMRLGKTLITIRRVNLYGYKDPHILVVAPTSTFGSWKEELEAEREERVIFLLGPASHRLAVLRSWGAKWYIVNKEAHLTLPELAGFPWDVIILDESTFIKNPVTKVTKFFLRNFRNVPHRWILTGMPNPESDLEFWPQMAFLDGVFCGTDSYWEFRNRYFHLPEWSFKWQPTNGAKKTITDRLGARAHCVRREEVGMNIKKVRETRIISMPAKVRKVYETAEQEFILEWKGAEVKRTIWATSKYIWLRQLCGGFLGDQPIWNGKAKELLSLLRGELHGASVVVWFNFNQEIKLCSRLLRKAGIVHSILQGNVPILEREVRRKRFSEGKFPVLLVQQAVAQMGMNLSRADTAIYYSQPVSLLASAQTEERIVHPSKRTPLLYVYLQVENSVDKDVQQALQNKNIRSQYTLSRILQAELHCRVLRRMEK